jgi:hypothetical protein
MGCNSVMADSGSVLMRAFAAGVGSKAAIGTAALIQPSLMST